MSMMRPSGPMSVARMSSSDVPGRAWNQLISSGEREFQMRSQWALAFRGLGPSAVIRGCLAAR
jgi:hypothetical protein